MQLIKFYTNVVESVGLTVDKEGFIFTPTSKKNIMVVVNKKPLVMPVPGQLSDMTEVIDGNVSVTKTLFNPLREDVVKGESDSLRKLKSMIDYNLSYSAAIAVQLMLELAGSKELQGKASLSLNDFVSTLNVARTANVTTVVDEGTMERWQKVYLASMKGGGSKSLIHIFLKKGGITEGVKYNRLAVTNFPLYKHIIELNKKTPLHGVKMRPKDLKVLKLVFEHIFKDIDDLSKYSIGSNDTESPGFISLYSSYIALTTRLNKLLTSLKFIDGDSVKEGMIKLKVTQAELTKLNQYAGDVAVIPSDLDAGRTVHTPLIAPADNLPIQAKAKTDVRSILNKQNMLAGTVNLPIRNNNLPIAQPQQQQAVSYPVVQQPQVVVQPQQQQVAMPQQQAGIPELTPAQKILYGNNNAPQFQQPQQMPQMQMQQMGQIPQFQQPQMYAPQNGQMQMPQQRPMGVNSMMQMPQQQIVFQ